MKIIGGEFEIDPASLRGGIASLPEGYRYSSGRSALYHVLVFARENLGFSKVFMPDYICLSAVEAARRSGMQVEYYGLNASLEAELSTMGSGGAEAAILLVNYFGGTDIEKSVDGIRTAFPSACVIVDNVMAYHAMSCDEGADFAFTSLRKHFPVPDGALVRTRYSGLAVPREINRFAYTKLAAGLLKNYRDCARFDDTLYLERFCSGEEMIDECYDGGMSEVSQLLMSAVDTVSAARRRMENAAYLSERIKNTSLKQLVEFRDGQVPHFIPVLSDRRDVLRAELASHGIFCPVHWPCFDQGMETARFMAENELSLVVDQRYGLEDMERIAEILKGY